MKKSEAPASVNTVKRMKMKKSEALAVDVDRRLLGHGGILPGCWPGGGRAPRRLPVILFPRCSRATVLGKLSPPRDGLGTVPPRVKKMKKNVHGTSKM